MFLKPAFQILFNNLKCTLEIEIFLCSSIYLLQLCNNINSRIMSKIHCSLILNIMIRSVMVQQEKMSQFAKSSQFIHSFLPLFHFTKCFSILSAFIFLLIQLYYLENCYLPSHLKDNLLFQKNWNNWKNKIVLTKEVE